MVVADELCLIVGRDGKERRARVLVLPIVEREVVGLVACRIRCQADTVAIGIEGVALIAIHEAHGVALIDFRIVVVAETRGCRETFQQARKVLL